MSEGVLIDSSVLIDILGPVTRWRPWSAALIERCARRESLFMNAVVLAEISAAAPESGARVPPGILRRDYPWAAAPLAGAAYGEYRRRGGTKETILPDFLIGAHASVENLAILTRDPRRIRTAFPNVRLITPETEPL